MLNFVLILFLSTSQQSMAFVKSWTSCVANEDCIKINAGCGRSGSINIKYKDKHALFMKKTAEASSCLQPTAEAIAEDKKLTTLCLKGQCEIISPTEN
jgi:hypothetical protein